MVIDQQSETGVAMAKFKIDSSFEDVENLKSDSGTKSSTQFGTKTSEGKYTIIFIPAIGLHQLRTTVNQLHTSSLPMSSKSKRLWISEAEINTNMN